MLSLHPLTRVRRAAGWVFVVALFNCTGGEGPLPVTRPGPPGTPLPLPPPDLVVRATGVQALSFETTSFALPPAMKTVPALHFAVKDDGRIIVGGSAGLYALGASQTSTISLLPIRGVFESAAVGFVVATDEGVFVYDGTLIPSQLDDALEGDRIAHFTPRGDQLWFASSRALYLLDGGSLFAFDEMAGVSGISTFAGGDIAVETATGGFAILSEVGTEWQRLDVEGELSMLAPGADGRVFGVFDGRLMERVQRANDGAMVWRRVSLVADRMDAGADGVRALVVDPQSGAVWIVQDAIASRIEADRIGTVALPAAFGPIIGSRVTSDGALWVADGERIVRIGSDEPALSFATQVRPYSDKNCARCHAPMLGISTLVLDSAEDWRNNIDTIIEQVESERMPLDAMPLLGGGVDLPRRWLSGGMQP